MRVQINGDDSAMGQVKANEACAMYKRRAEPMSWRCLDGYCIFKELLFACIEAPISTPAATSSPAPTVTAAPRRDASGREYDVNQLVMCMFANSKAPEVFTAHKCTLGGGRIVGPA